MSKVSRKSEVHPMWWLAAVGIWFVIAFVFVAIKDALFPQYEPGLIALALMVYCSGWIARSVCRRKPEAPPNIQVVKKIIAEDKRKFESAWDNLDGLSFNSMGLMLELAKSQSAEWRKVDRYFIYNPDMGGENASAEPLRRGLIEIDDGEALRMRLTQKGLKLMEESGFMMFPFPQNK